MLPSDGGGRGGFLSSDGGGGGRGLPSDGGGGGFLAGDGGGGGGGFPSDGGGVGGGTIDGGYTRTGVIERTGKAVCCGFASLLIFLPLTCLGEMYNEYNLVIAEATANLVDKALVVPSCVPDGQDNGRLIFASCAVSAPDISQQLSDSLRPFFPDYHGASMSWDTQIYQYSETSSKDCRKNNDGSQTCHTTYSYRGGWESQPINSNGFAGYGASQRFSNRNTNFPDNLQQSGAVEADEYSVILHSSSASSGPAYALPQDIANQLPQHALAPQGGGGFGGSSWQGAGFLSPGDLHPSGNLLTTGQGSPRIGDLKIQVKGKMSQYASVAAQQQGFSGPGFTLDSYPPHKFDFWGRKTRPLARLEAGQLSKSKFIADFHAENNLIAMVVRLITFCLMIFFCFQVLSPLSVAADLLRVINCFTCGLGTVLDNAAQCVIGTVSCALGCSCWLIVAALAWMFVRPTLGIGLLVIGLGGYIALPRIIEQVQGKKQAKAREQDGYLKMPGFDAKKVQPVPCQV